MGTGVKLMYGEFTSDFHYDTIRNGFYRLEVFAYTNGYKAFQLDLVGDQDTMSLDYMILNENPELGEIYDFDNNQWVEAELACFWMGLQVCLA